MGVISYLLDFVLNCGLGMKKGELVHDPFFIRLMPSAASLQWTQGTKTVSFRKDNESDTLQITLLRSWVAL